MSKIGPRNPLIKRLLLMLFIFIIVCAIIVYTIFTLKKNTNQIYFNLGNIEKYSDEIINSYDEYQKFISKYSIDYDLTSESFKNNSYVMSFQTYDKCSEKKVKTVSNINYGNDIVNISFDIHNKCGWCKPDVIVYIIKLDRKIMENANINYNYEYDNEIDCGSI